MIAKAAKAVLIENVDVCEGTTFLSVRLDGDDHWTMFQSYRKLPPVVKHDGMMFGLTGWDSDKGLAYYRNDRLVAVAG